jgi:uncharacterized protein (DUF934 family)
MTNVLIQDTGFVADDFTGMFLPPEALPANDAALAVDLASDADLAVLDGLLDRITAIRVDFPSFADGRGFTIAAQLRRIGFTGRLRAHGHVIADQYAMARRSGFDEVEIPQALAERQPEPEWLARANWQTHSYQNRMRG